MLPAAFDTARLHARLPVASDAAALFAAYTADPAVSRYMMWTPHADVSTTETFVADCIAAADDGTRFPYVLARHADPTRPIGMLEARPKGHQVDLGYVLATSAWGQGLMPEAVAAFASLALDTLGFFRVQAFCDVENVGSQRTLEKAGFVREGRHARFIVHPNLSDEPRACFMYARCR